MVNDREEIANLNALHSQQFKNQPKQNKDRVCDLGGCVIGGIRVEVGATWVGVLQARQKKKRTSECKARVAQSASKTTCTTCKGCAAGETDSSCTWGTMFETLLVATTGCQYFTWTRNDICRIHETCNNWAEPGTEEVNTQGFETYKRLSGLQRAIGVGSKELLEWAPKSYWSGLQRAIGVGFCPSSTKDVGGKMRAVHYF